VTGVGLEALRSSFPTCAERFDGDFPLGVQDLHETRHVSAFEVVRRLTYNVEGGNRVLLAGRAIADAHGMADVLDADAV